MCRFAKAYLTAASGCDEHEPCHFGRRTDARRRAHGAEATVHVQRGAPDLVPPRHVPEEEIGRTKPRVYLTAMGVTAQLQRDLPGPQLDRRWLMRQKDSWHVRRHHRQGLIEPRPRASVALGPSVIHTEKGEASAVARPHEAPLVDEEVDSRRAKDAAHRGGSRVVVVIAQDRRYAVARRELHELASRERGEPRIHVDDVAGDDDQIGASFSDEVEARVEIALRHVETDVKIADLRD